MFDCLLLLILGDNREIIVKDFRVCMFCVYLLLKKIKYNEFDMDKECKE